MAEPAYMEISRRKVAERDSKIPPEWKVEVPDREDLTSLPRESGLLSQREVEITESYDSVGLLRKIRDGTFSSVEVTTAFCKRSAIAQQALNCLTEIFFDQALARAAFLDDHLRTHGQPLGPLHGLPIAFKDSINIVGIDSCIGMTALAFKPAFSNSIIVDMLLELGAVPYVKTNVPQSMMVPDTENFVFGRTRNPRHSQITASGSSGGLGALVGIRGALMGIGTDVGGSIRIPAYSNGVYGVKPSSGRLPYSKLQGYLTSGAEDIGILCVNGVIASSTRDCEYLLRAVTQAEPWLYDPGCPYSPWDLSPLPDRPLVFGVILEDHETTLLPPVERILRETCEKLRAAGHEVIDIEFYKSKELSENAVAFFQIEGGKGLDTTRNATGEPYTTSVQQGGLYPCEQGTLSGLFTLTTQRLALQEAWLKYWASTASMTKSGRPIDAILCPAQSSVPRTHEVLIRSHFSRNFNNLDYPAAVVQCGHVDLVKDHVEELPPPKGAVDEMVQSLFTKEKRKPYDGFPIGLQLVCQRQMEAKLMKIASVVDDLVQAS